MNKMGTNNQMKLEMAKRLAAKINFSKNLGQEAQDITQQATKAIFQDGVSAPQVAVSRLNTSTENLELIHNDILEKDKVDLVIRYFYTTVNIYLHKLSLDWRVVLCGK